MDRNLLDGQITYIRRFKAIIIAEITNTIGKIRLMDKGARIFVLEQIYQYFKGVNAYSNPKAI